MSSSQYLADTDYKDVLPFISKEFKERGYFMSFTENIPTCETSHTGTSVVRWRVRNLENGLSF